MRSSAPGQMGTMEQRPTETVRLLTRSLKRSFPQRGCEKMATQRAALPDAPRRDLRSATKSPAAKARKIVHLTSVHNAFDTRIFSKDCRSLARAGFQVTIVAPHTEDTTKDGVRIWAVPLAKDKGRLHRMTATAWRILREAWQIDADIYHFHDP